MGFFDEATAYTDKKLNRVNERYRRIIEANIEHIRGKRILDLASHDGRWAWAALKSGAASVLGIEGRQELIDSPNFSFKEFAPGQSRFVCGDIFEVLDTMIKSEPGLRFDTVLCLGIFYHINDHSRLLDLMTRVQPAAIILDSALIDSEKPFIKLFPEDTAPALNAIPSREGQRQTVVGVVSVGGLKALAASFGYGVRFVEWNAAECESTLNIEDYFTRGEAKKGRFTAVLSPL
ncbi:MAG: hypothetical protein QOD99_2252 [Chthoniobacter sp.]|jgi:hypothetical protein|nr:hypothetical protein [Chthoniobacter sp.]